MRPTRNPPPAATAPAVNRDASWIPWPATRQVGLDPARWSTRGPQVALWLALDSWQRNRRRH